VRRLVVLVVSILIGQAAAMPVVSASPAPLGPPAERVEASTKATNAVTWSVDQDAKTITATVHLTLATACSSEEAYGLAMQGARWAAKCRVGDDVVKAIKADIAAMWGGATYRCYRLILDVDIQVDQRTADRRTPFTADDRVFVAIDRTTAGFRSHTFTSQRASARWDGNTAADRSVPLNGDDPPSTWGYPPGQGQHLYAHEIAHVLGLDDQYEDVTDADGNVIGSRPRPGAPNDLLASSWNDSVNQSTVDRLIERSDAFKTEKVKCDYRIDTKVDGWMHFTAKKCGGPEGDWFIKVDGERDLGGAKLVLSGSTLFANLTRSDATFTGPWDGAYHIDLVGIPHARGGQEGTISGTATLASRILHLKGVTARGSFWSQTPAWALAGASMDPLKNLDLPVVNGAFCP
jgi:hypothetical protein